MPKIENMEELRKAVDERLDFASVMIGNRRRARGDKPEGWVEALEWVRGLISEQSENADTASESSESDANEYLQTA